MMEWADLGLGSVDFGMDIELATVSNLICECPELSGESGESTFLLQIRKLEESMPAATTLVLSIDSIKLYFSLHYVSTSLWDSSIFTAPLRITVPGIEINLPV
jgi:hypothetical protein